MNGKAAIIESIVGTAASRNDPTHRQSGAPRQTALRLWFYVGVPLVMGFMLGWTQVGRAAEWPKSIALLYWLGFTFGSFYLLDLGTRPFAWLFRPRGVPLWATLIVGQLAVGWIAILPLSRLYTAWIHGFVSPALAGPLPSSSLPELLQRLPSNLVFWVGLNLLFFHGLGMARFGYVPPRWRRAAAQAPHGETYAAPSSTSVAAPIAVDEEAGAAPEAAFVPTERRSELMPVAPRHEPARSEAEFRKPAFLARVRPERDGELLALQADGHYLRVYTVAGSDLILYRLGDALAELPDSEGMRVHRSWWVAERAVSPDTAGDRLRLVNGLEVPVSRSYRVQARERGWLG